MKTEREMDGYDAAGILCAEPLRAVAAELEAVDKSGDSPRAVALLADIQTEMDHCLSSLPAHEAILTTMRGASAK